MNTTMTLYPYMLRNTWVFDDKTNLLKEEAFVLGMTEIISATVSKKRLRRPGKGFQMEFSAIPFDHDIMLTWFDKGDLAWTDKDGEKHAIPGNWYHTGDYFRKGPKIGWLCPALLKYFPTPPEHIFVKATNLPADIDPIWHGGSKFFAYVQAAQAA